MGLIRWVKQPAYNFGAVICTTLRTLKLEATHIDVSDPMKYRQSD